MSTRTSRLDSLLPALSEAYGPPGRESGIRAAIKRAVRGLGKASEDALGNVHLHVGGKGPRLLLTAHMDAPGIIVTRVDASGLARISLLGPTAASARRRLPSASRWEPWAPSTIAPSGSGTSGAAATWTTARAARR